GAGSGGGRPGRGVGGVAASGGGRRGAGAGCPRRGLFPGPPPPRLCIDRRQSIEERKKSYIGPWLPDPVVDTDPASRLEAAESVSMALLLVLESLSPVERAAYLLRRLFDYEYREISEILGKTEANCRPPVSPAEGPGLRGAP